MATLDRDMQLIALSWREPEKDRYRWLSMCANIVLLGMMAEGADDTPGSREGDIIQSLSWLRDSCAKKADFSGPINGLLPFPLARPGTPSALVFAGLADTLDGAYRLARSIDPLDPQIEAVSIWVVRELYSLAGEQ